MARRNAAANVQDGDPAGAARAATHPRIFDSLRKLAWHSPVWYLLILVSILLYIIVALIIRHTATIQVGYCDMHRSKRRRAITIGWVLALGGIGLTVVAASLTKPIALLVVLGVVVFLVGLIWGIVGSQVVSPKRIDARYVWLKQVSPDYLAELPAWEDVLVPPG